MTKNSNKPKISYDPTKLVDAWADWIQEQRAEGRRLYLFSFMFEQLPGRPETKLMIMEQELTRIYAAMLTRIVRRPKGKPSLDLPVWLAFPDRPVPKTVRRDVLSQIVPNDGVHMHAIVAIPKSSRIDKLIAHVRDYRDLYLGREGRVTHIDVRRLKRTASKATRYVLKSLERQRWDDNQVLVLPRSSTELSA
jgi:hypothetical protein